MTNQIVPWRGQPMEPPIVEGRVPPHDLDAEAAVLSAVLIDPMAIGKVDFLHPEHFYSERHRQIFAVAEELGQAGQKVDIVTVASILKTRERLVQIGGMGYLTEVLNAAPCVANVRAYAITGASTPSSCQSSVESAPMRSSETTSRTIAAMSTGAARRRSSGAAP